MGFGNVERSRDQRSAWVNRSPRSSPPVRKRRLTEIRATGFDPAVDSNQIPSPYAPNANRARHRPPVIHPINVGGRAPATFRHVIHSAESLLRNAHQLLPKKNAGEARCRQWWGVDQRQSRRQAVSTSDFVMTFFVLVAQGRILLGSSHQRCPRFYGDEDTTWLP